MTSKANVLMLRAVFEYLLGYSPAIRAAISLLGAFTLHLLVLKELVFRSLSPLVDASFIADATSDVVVAVILSGLAAKVLVFSTMASAIPQSFWVFRMIMGKFLGWLGIVPDEFEGDARMFVDSEIERATGLFREYFFLFEIPIALLFFTWFYASSALSAWNVVVFAIGCYVWVRAVSKAISFLEMTPAEFFDMKTLLADGKSFGTFASLFTVTLLLLVFIFAHARAEHIKYNNGVAISIRDESSSLCVSLLGKSGNGIFVANYFFDDSNPVYFIPFGRIDRVTSAGGTDFSMGGERKTWDCRGAEIGE